MLIAPGKAGELVSDENPFQWQQLTWLNCDCGSPLCAPRSPQGHIGKWALCTAANCRKMWQLSISGNDVVANLDGSMPTLVHTRITG